MGLKKIFNNTSCYFSAAIIIMWILIIGSIFFVVQIENKIRDVYLDELIQSMNDYKASIYTNDSTNTDQIKLLYNGDFGRETRVEIFDTDGNLLAGSDNDSKSYIRNLNEIIKLQDFNTDRKLTKIETIDGKNICKAYTFFPQKQIIIYSELEVSNLPTELVVINIIYSIIVILIGLCITTSIFVGGLKIEKSVLNLNRVLHLIRNGANPRSVFNSEWKDRLSSFSEDMVSYYEERNRLIQFQNLEREKLVTEEKNKLKSKRVIANNLNHELKTPIGIIQGYLETLVAHQELPTELRLKFLNNSLKNLRRIDNLITNLSMASRLEDGASSIMLDKLSLYESLETIKDDQEAKLNSNNIKFINEIPKEVVVRSNFSLLYALFHNLIKSAINYANCSEIGVKLISEDDQFYTIRFWDNGVGVSEEHIGHLFERFYRVENYLAPAKEGSGLGLSIVENVIQIHGSTIKSENRKEGGLSFIFTLPKFIENISEK